jgi:transcriptional regulator with XRE-family HTH domain
MAEDSQFALNLRFACSFFPSISHVCRKLQINRQQFNAYLSGERTPSQFNLKKLCDYFGVEESEMFLSHDQFAELISGRGGRQIVPEAFATAYFDIVASQSGSLDKYAGRYYCYTYSCSSPGFVNRSLVVIRKVGNRYLARTYERFAPVSRSGSLQRAAYFKRHGLVFMNTSRLFLVDYDTSESHTPAATVFMPTIRNAFTFLQGVRLDISSGAMQRPFAARSAMELLAADVSLRLALRGTGLLHENAPELGPEIRAMISNSLPAHSHVLTVSV